MSGEELFRENAALLALLRTCQKPNTWTSIANDCVMEGSAERLLLHRIDPANHPLFTVLQHEDNHVNAVQDALFDDDISGDESPRKQALLQAKDDAADQLERWQDSGFDYISVFDDRFPERLRLTVDVPPFLFADGEVRSDDVGVSVVGSRKCSPEGARFAVECARMLVDRGLTVIAGLAKGIDTFAHETALERGGRTVAFIGTGIDVHYPPENRALQETIARRGLVLSQFFPGAPPTKQSFPMRNALMSGYGAATIIADAGEYSGTRIQARQAQRHGRPVILYQMVVENAQWARALVGNPGVHVVNDVQEASKVVDYILNLEQYADSLVAGMLESRMAFA